VGRFVLRTGPSVRRMCEETGRLGRPGGPRDRGQRGVGRSCGAAAAGRSRGV